MRFLLILAFIIWTPALMQVLARVFGELGRDLELLQRLLLGMGVGGLIFGCVLRRIPGLMTLQHEIKHALVALLCLRRVRRFVVTARRGGMIEYSGRRGGAIADHAIGLAPYYLPPLTVAVALVIPLFPTGSEPGLQIVFGAVFAIDLLCLRRDVMANFNKDLIHLTDGSSLPSDIGRRGYLLTLASIAFHGSILLILSFSLLLWGYSGLPDVAVDVGKTWQDHILYIIDSLLDLEMLRNTP